MPDHYTIAAHVPTGKMPLEIVYMGPGLTRRKRFHDHDHSEIVFILSGTGYHLFNGKSFPVKPGDVLLIHPGATHAYDHRDLEMVNIIYDIRQLYLPILDGAELPLFQRIFPDIRKKMESFGKPILSLAPRDMKKILRLIRNMRETFHSQRPGTKLYCLSVFLETVMELCWLYKGEPAKEKPPFRIGAVMAYMNAHYQEPVSIDRLARSAYTSQRNFFLQFKSATGCSPIQYLTKLRISRAEELLTGTMLSIGEIADRCGFSDSNYFCKTFHRHTGMSPRQFRQKNRSGS